MEPFTIKPAASTLPPFPMGGMQQGMTGAALPRRLGAHSRRGVFEGCLLGTPAPGKAQEAEPQRARVLTPGVHLTI